MNRRARIILSSLGMALVTAMLNAVQHKKPTQTAKPMAQKQAMKKIMATPMAAKPMALSAAEKKQTIAELKTAIKTNNAKGLADPFSTALAELAATGDPNTLKTLNQQVQNSALSPAIKAAANAVTTKAVVVRSTTDMITPAQLQEFNSVLQQAAGTLLQ